MSFDVSRLASSEVKPSTAARFEGFDPDRRIDVRSKAQSGNEVFDPDKRIEGLYTSRADRVRCAGYTDGEWSGDVGDSSVRPNLDSILGRAAFEKMKEFGISDISYMDGVVDFAKCSVESVEIEHMTSDIETNRAQALDAVAQKWNSEGRLQDNGREWTSNAVRDWASKNGLSFHECSDMKTCQFVPKEIHNYFKHYGGRAECRIRDMQANGGGFDE